PVFIEPPKPPPAPEPQMVNFEITSTPPGATVSMDGRTLGTTPFNYPLKASDGDAAHAQLTFALEGYQSVTVSAAGKGTVQVAQALKKKTAAPKKRPPGGYKEDPYQ